VHRDLLLKVADVIRDRVSDHDLPVVSVDHDRRVEHGRGDGV